MEKRDTPHEADDADNFKPVFKKFKRRDKALDLSEVVDLNTVASSSLGSDSSIVCVKPIIPSVTPVVGLKPVQDWRIFHFLNHKGFYLIVNPFVLGSQRYWVSRCLQDLPLPPHVTNLPVHLHLDPATVWSSFVHDYNKSQCQTISPASPLRKLRWTTIGYHYNWDTKEYAEEDHTPFPQDIAVLSQFVARVLGFPQFRAEAGIINYYHHDSTLGAHTDHSELDHDAPLLSFSLGQDAVFLMGGLTKAQSPTPVMLHSGDICVMSGDARLAYHAVPRILPSPTLTPPPCFHLTQQDWQAMHTSVAMDTRIDVERGAEDRTGVTGVSNTTGSSESPSVKSTSHTPVRNLTSNMSTSTHCPKSLSARDVASHASASSDNGESPSLESETHTAETATCKRRRRSPSEENKSHAATMDSCKHKMKSLSEESKAETASSDSLSGMCVCTQSASEKSEGHTGTSDSGRLTSASEGSMGDTREYEAAVRQVNRDIMDRLESLQWGPFAAYLSASRLNINIRQVLKAGQTFHTTH